MLPKRVVAIFLFYFFIFGLTLLCAQTRLRNDKSQDINRRFFAEESKCRNLIKSQKWREAEAACKIVVQLADQLKNDRALEKMGAYEMMGHVLMGQARYQDAITYYSRAMNAVHSRLKETDAEMGRLYGDIAIAHHSLRNLDKAREFYRKAESTYQIAYSSINPEEVTEDGVEMKRGYMKALKRLLQYHILAAEQAGAKSEAEEIRKLLEGLP